MPEGDTIFKAATVLRRALLGRWPISRLVGTTVEAVEPRGKHLLLRFSNGLPNQVTSV
jgi:hypothetical protein